MTSASAMRMSTPARAHSPYMTRSPTRLAGRGRVRVPARPREPPRPRLKLALEDTARKGTEKRLRGPRSPPVAYRISITWSQVGHKWLNRHRDALRHLARGGRATSRAVKGIPKRKGTLHCAPRDW